MIADNKRIQSIYHVLLEAKEIYQKVSATIPEMKELAEQMRQGRVLIVAPREGGIVEEIDEVLHSKNANQSPELNQKDFDATLKIYPFFKEDTVFGKAFELYALHELGTYSYLYNMVVVNMEAPETTTFQAHTLLHELRHAFYAIKEKRALAKDLRTQQERILEETKIWTTDYKILLGIGGKKYEQETRKFAYHVHQCWKKKMLIEPVRKGHLLKTAYGPAPSQMALLRRDIYFRMYGEIMAADYYEDPKKQDDMKSQILGDKYGAMYAKQSNFIAKNF